ncbi:hypothetical protein Csa_007770, partial [Cucumis sativus]
MTLEKPFPDVMSEHHYQTCFGYDIQIKRPSKKPPDQPHFPFPFLTAHTSIPAPCHRAFLTVCGKRPAATSQPRDSDQLREIGVRPLAFLSVPSTIDFAASR